VLYNCGSILIRKDIEHFCPLVRPWLAMGRVFLVRPGADPCKACLGEYARASRSGECAPADWIDVIESTDEFLAHECGRPVIPASAADLEFVAAIISRVAIDYLEGKSLEENHWLWSRTPAPDVDPRFDRPMVTHLAKLPRWSDCWACREPDIAQVVMNQEVRNCIAAMTEESSNSETGGILIGTIDDQHRAVVLRATGPGPGARKSKEGFARDVEYVQAELDRLTRETKWQAVYIGEWHSHLESDPQPSTRDIDSMSGIAAAPNYLTRCPVLLIAGLDTKTQQVAALKTWAFPIGGRMYPIANELLPVPTES
jgi:integrative and conjugative element protein (TIGR02256 family)